MRYRRVGGRARFCCASSSLRFLLALFPLPPLPPLPLLLSPLPGNHDGESGLNYKQVADYLLTLPNGLNEPNPNNVNGSGEPIYGNTNFWLGVRMRRAACARALAASR